MKFTKKIVRIGGQSKCEALQPFSLREWKFSKNRPTLTNQYYDWLYDSRRELNDTKQLVALVF